MVTPSRLAAALSRARSRVRAEQTAGEAELYALVASWAAQVPRRGALEPAELATRWFERWWSLHGAGALDALAALDPALAEGQVRTELATLARNVRLQGERAEAPLRRYFRRQVDRASEDPRFARLPDGRIARAAAGVGTVGAGVREVLRGVAPPARPRVAGGRYAAGDASVYAAWMEAVLVQEGAPVRPSAFVARLLAVHGSAELGGEGWVEEPSHDEDRGTTFVIETFGRAEGDRVLERLDAAGQVAQVLATLVPVERRVLELRGHGESPEEIARTTGIGPQRQRDVLKKVRARFAPPDALPRVRERT